MPKILRIITTLFAALTVTIVMSVITSAETIGLSLPLSGPVAELGREFRAGANLAMEKYGDGHELFIVDDGCEADLARLAIDDLTNQNPAIITGMLCNEAAIIAANRMREAGTPVLIAGARSIRLIKDREREEWNIWRMSPGDDQAHKVAAKEIIKRWKNTPYAIVDDGTIFGRSFTDGLRLKMDEAGLKPQISDTFRAAQSTQAGLLRRLQRSGVTAAFIASATTEDLVMIAQNMQDLNVQLEVITTDQLAVLPYLPQANEIKAGISIIKEAYPDTKDRAEINGILRKRNILPTAQIHAGYAAIQVAITALGDSVEATRKNLTIKQFETILGPVKFAQNGANIINPYKLHIWNGETFVLPDTEETPTQ